MDWKKTLISSDTSIHRAMEVIDKASFRVALVVDKNKVLQGVVTDGDIRRAILKRIDIAKPVSLIMNKKPTFVYEGDTEEHILGILHTKQIIQMPIVDEKHRVVGLETVDTLASKKQQRMDVVLMAGGFGKRLYPLTQDTPKPMLKVGNKPILEVILQNFIDSGFKNFFISVHFKPEVIKKHFGDGKKFGVNIKYIDEKTPHGTAGALSLLPKNISENFIVMNADIMTRVNLGHLVNFHNQHESLATMCVREYQHTVPFGVVEIEDYEIKSIKEKPTQSFFVSAGIYVLNKKIIPQIPKSKYFDMPSLFDKLIKAKKPVTAFPIHEYWLDVGSPESYEYAQRSSE